MALGTACRVPLRREQMSLIGAARGSQGVSLYRWHVAVAAGAVVVGGLVLGAVLPPRWWGDGEG